jgi:hypothetical protein
MSSALGIARQPNALPKLRQIVIVFVARPTQQSSSPAPRQTVGNEFAVSNLMACAQVLLEFGDEGPRGNVAGSAPEPDHGWSRGSTSGGLQHLMGGGLADKMNNPKAAPQPVRTRFRERTVPSDRHYGILSVGTVKNDGILNQCDRCHRIGITSGFRDRMQLDVEGMSSSSSVSVRAVIAASIAGQPRRERHQ